MKVLTEWPKPRSFPWASTLFLIINAIVIYLFNKYDIHLGWMVPPILLNIFFFVAEKDIYRREKRNYDSWNKEMGYLMGLTDKEGKPIQDPRKHFRRRKKKVDNTQLKGKKGKGKSKNSVDLGIITGPQTV